jgi:hypothetical protein
MLVLHFQSNFKGDKMAKYRKKPVVIEAIKWDGNNYLQMDDFIGSNNNLYTKNKKLNIITLEGTMTANIGDYIIKGVEGEFYPCKPDIFHKTYEKVEEAN